MENYTNQEQTGQEQNPQDLLNASLIFARALGLILKENEGIVVDIKGDVKISQEVKKVIVFKFEDQIHIYKCEEDLEEGTAVNMDTTESNEQK
jgi:pantoate kinase